MKAIQVLTIGIIVTFCFAQERWNLNKMTREIPGFESIQKIKPKMMMRSANERNGRIVGGWEVAPNYHPYQVALFLGYPNSTTSFLCGGSILNNKTILTAAHCIDGTIRAQIVFGAHNISSLEPTQLRVDVNSSRYRCHFAYNFRNLNNDICIILLNEEIQFNKYIQPILLPSSPELREKSFVTELATVR